LDVSESKCLGILKVDSPFGRYKVNGLVKVVLFPLFFIILLIDLFVVPTEAVVAETLLRVPTLRAVLGIALLAVVEFLSVHAAYLAQWHLLS
jgi:hypothetical protein